MSRSFLTVDGVQPLAPNKARINGALDALLTWHISTDSSVPTYAQDGMVWIYDGSGTGNYSYWVQVAGSPVQLGEELWNTWTGNRDFGLSQALSFVLETLSSTPGTTTTPGRLVYVDSGTNDAGFAYVCDSEGFNRVLDNRAEHTPLDASRYYRLQLTSPDASQGSLISGSGESSIAFTTVSIPAVLSSQYAHVATDLDALAILQVTLVDTGGVASLSFRKVGTSGTDTDGFIKVITAGANLTQHAQVMVPLSAGQLQYKLTASGSSTATFTVRVIGVHTYS